jgi:8-oxo-dGTP pyrophosphatase MutT (NUDIX family)
MKKPISFRREFSAGGIVYKKQVTLLRQPTSLKLRGSGRLRKGMASSKEQVLWLIGKHSGYHKWVLPKGLIEKGERGYETALREVEEEMGIRASLVSEKPIHRVSYVYWADFKDKQVTSNKKQVTSNKKQGIKEGKVEIERYEQSDEAKLVFAEASTKRRRRVEKYQEEPSFAKASEGKRMRVFKVVSFYLMEYESGDVADHDWEMEAAVWLPFEEAIGKLAFKGEREALRQAQDKLLAEAHDTIPLKLEARS